MKLSALLLLSLLSWHVQLVAGSNNKQTTTQYAPFVTFNHGVSNGTECSAVELELITARVSEAANPAGGGESSLSSAMPAVDNHHRQLWWNRLVQCTRPLMVYGDGRCGREAKRLFRRHLKLRTRTLKRQDERASDTAKFDAALDNVQPMLSASCQAFVETRSIECRQVADCDITSLYVWNADKDKTKQQQHGVIDTDGDVLEYCDTMNINIEARTTFDVGNVAFELIGVDPDYSYASQDYQAPYYIFGNDGVDVWGQTLPVGLYNFTAIVTDSPESEQMFQFRVTSC
jgi:hypothetical protein